MMTTCFLQASLVFTPLSTANRRHNLSNTSPVLIHNFDFHHLSSSKLNHLAYFTSSGFRTHLYVSSDRINLTRSCDSEKAEFSRNGASSSEVVSNNGGVVNLQNESGETGLSGNVKKGFQKVMLSEPFWHREKLLDDLIAETDPNQKLQLTTKEAKGKLKMDEFPLNSSNFVIMAALTVGVTVLLLDQKAMALGPEGPLMEEFWENMRRYALYALTVSTGVAYAVFQPLYELLRNPISAILIIGIAVGSFYLVSQILSAMVGVSDFTYEYS